MDLATCSYPEFKKEMGFPLRISIGSPKFNTEYELTHNHWTLTPRMAYLRASDAVFYGRLQEQLEQRGPEKIWRDLERIADEVNAERIVMLCFERLDKRNDCHRTFVAKWLSEQLDIEIPELGATPERPGGNTPALF